MVVYIVEEVYSYAVLDTAEEEAIIRLAEEEDLTLEEAAQRLLIETNSFPDFKEEDRVGLEVINVTE